MFRRQSYTSYPLMRKTLQRDLKGSLALPLRCWGDTQAWVITKGLYIIHFAVASLVSRSLIGNIHMKYFNRIEIHETI